MPPPYRRDIFSYRPTVPSDGSGRGEGGVLGRWDGPPEAAAGHMRNFGSRPEVKEALQGYMDLVDGGHREIYKIV